MEQIEVINLRLPSELVKIIDSMVEKGLYHSRSEAIRDFARSYILEQKK